MARVLYGTTPVEVYYKNGNTFEKIEPSMKLSEHYQSNLTFDPNTEEFIPLEEDDNVVYNSDNIALGVKDKTKTTAIIKADCKGIDTYGISVYDGTKWNTYDWNNSQIENLIFLGTDIEYLNIPDSLPLKRLEIPVGTKSLFRIESGNNINTLEKVVLSENSILGGETGQGVFKNCLNLNDINIENCIGFTYTSLENSPYLENHLTQYQNALYLGSNNNPYYCLYKILEENPTTFTVHSDCKIMSSYVFNQSNVYSTIEEVNLPNGLKAISDHCFKNCGALTTINIPNSVKYIFRDAFYLCTNLEITLPDGIEKIERDAFMRTTITNTHFPNLVKIEYRTFAYTTFKNGNPIFSNKLMAITGNAAFRGSNLTGIPNLGNNITEYPEDTFQECRSMTIANIPNGITSIGNQCFSNCTSITNVSIPNTVVNIGYRAFNECSSLQSIVIPSSVLSMGSQVFRKCTNLSTIYCEAASKPDGWDDNWNTSNATVIWGYNQ